MGPLAAVAPALIGAGGSIFGGLMGSKKSKEEKNALTKQSALADAQTSLANDQRSQMNQMWGTASPIMTQIRDYFSKLLSGDRGAVGQVMAPEMEYAAQQYGGAEKDILSNVPRGGEMGLALAQNRMGKAGTIGGMYREAPKMGMAGLQDLFSMLTGQAGAAGNSASSTMNSAGNMFNNMLLNERERKLNTTQMGGQAGIAIGQLIQQLLGGGNSGDSNAKKYGAMG